MMKRNELLKLSNGLSVDKAQQLTELVAETVTGIAFADVDGDGLEFSEILPVTGNLIFKGTITFGSKGAFKEILTQFADADYQERKQLIEAAARKFKLPNPEHEAIIEDWLTHLNETGKLVKRTKTAFTA